MMLARNELRAASMAQNAVQADIGAQSLADLATYWVANDQWWRTNYTNNTWTTPQTVGGVSFTYKLIDELDGNLADDPNEPVRLYGKATVGDAVRIYSVRLNPRPVTNLLSNAGMESGTPQWSAFNCTIESRSDDAHSGNKSLLVKSRTSSSACPYQDIAGFIEKGAVYQLEAWAKVDSGSCNVQVAIYTLSSSGGSQYFTGPSTAVGTTWTRVIGTVTPTWSGTLNAAYFNVFTASGTTTFRFDDALMRRADSLPAVIAAPGTWRREVQ